jgi:ADP-heptose:LPS heptosyltransferase
MAKALIIQLARFGDLVQTRRLVRSLLAEGCEVHLCLDRSLAPLAELVHPECRAHPVIAHATGLGPEAASLAILTDNRRAFAALRAEQFDAVYNLNFSGMAFRVAALFDPEIVVGYRWKNGQEVVPPWSALGMRLTRDRRLGMNLQDFWAHYAPRPIDPGELNPVPAPRGGGLGVVLAGRESRRSLPVPVLAAVAATMAARMGAQRLALLGSGAERPAARQFMKLLPKWRGTMDDLAGKTDWPGLVDAVSGLDRLITPDTGTMHLAAQLGVPVTAFFLSSAWCFETGPYGQGHEVHQAVAECAPCLESAPCPHALRCLEPLAGQGMLRYIGSGKAEHCPPGVATLRSTLDALGTNYECLAGAVPGAMRMAEFRAFLAAHVHAADGFSGAAECDFARSAYQESDWMVPYASIGVSC